MISSVYWVLYEKVYCIRWPDRESHLLLLLDHVQDFLLCICDGKTFLPTVIFQSYNKGFSLIVEPIFFVFAVKELPLDLSALGISSFGRLEQALFYTNSTVLSSRCTLPQELHADGEEDPHTPAPCICSCLHPPL